MMFDVLATFSGCREKCACGKASSGQVLCLALDRILLLFHLRRYNDPLAILDNVSSNVQSVQMFAGHQPNAR